MHQRPHCTGISDLTQRIRNVHLDVLLAIAKRAN